MVICFIPGAGGHRYKRYLSGESIDKTNTQMHTLTTEIEKSYRYLCPDTKNIGSVDIANFATTHTMNSDLIRKFYPGHSIIKIKAPIDVCLERQWILIKKPEVATLSLPDQIDQAYALITWHKKYYEENVIDYECDQLINIETDQTEFGVVMRRELEYQDKVFRLALESYYNFGYDAPIIEIFSNMTFNE